MSTYHNNFVQPGGQYPRDTDGFGGIAYGGEVNVRYGEVAYTQNGVTAYLGTLPKGAIIVGWLTNVDTAFNDSGTDVLDIGDGTTANRFANDIDISSVGQKLTGYDPDEMFTPLEEETKLMATYAGQNSNASAGHAFVACFFIVL